MAYIAIEELDYPTALVYLDRGLALEPDHPDLWHEKAFALSRLGQFEEARQSYLKQMDVRPWSSKLNTASAWRGVGNVLIDMNRLDEAEEALNKSRVLEPGNENAQIELQYIAEMRSNNKR